MENDEPGLNGVFTSERVETVHVETVVSTGPAVCRVSSTGGCQTWTSTTLPQDFDPVKRVVFRTNGQSERNDGGREGGG